MKFFFSSRRRHTRLQGDWSSDVYSSDLWWLGEPRASVECRERAYVGFRRGGDAAAAALAAMERSEERRVGKECRSRTATRDEVYQEGDLARTRFCEDEKDVRALSM